MCQQLGWLVNLEKSELQPKQVFHFVGYHFDLRSTQVSPTPDRLQNLQHKILALLSQPACLVRQFMSLIGPLTATEKQVHIGRLHITPIQWHLRQSSEEVAGLSMQENHSDCSRVAQHALFLDLVTMSSQVPLSLPNLLTQPFNQILHKNLTNLKLHAWLLELQ